MELSGQPWSGSSLQISQSWAQHTAVVLTERMGEVVASVGMQPSSWSFVPGGLWCDDGGSPQLSRPGLGELQAAEWQWFRGSDSPGSPVAKTHVLGRHHLSRSQPEPTLDADCTHWLCGKRASGVQGRVCVGEQVKEVAVRRSVLMMCWGWDTANPGRPLIWDLPGHVSTITWLSCCDSRANGTPQLPVKGT